MLKRIGVVSVIAVLATTWAIRGNAAEERQTLPKPPDKQMLRAEEVKQMLLLMDTDENGKISKQEWLRFMEAEFDRLDKDKSGELDVKELTQTRIRGFHK